MKEENKLLKSKDVAWILDCSPDHVVELARSQKLRGAKAGRFWRFRPEDVTAYKRRLEKEQMTARLSPFA